MCRNVCCNGFCNNLSLVGLWRGLAWEPVNRNQNREGNWEMCFGSLCRQTTNRVSKKGFWGGENTLALSDCVMASWHRGAGAFPRSISTIHQACPVATLEVEFILGTLRPGQKDTVAGTRGWSKWSDSVAVKCIPFACCSLFARARKLLKREGKVRKEI